MVAWCTAAICARSSSSAGSRGFIALTKIKGLVRRHLTDALPTLAESSQLSGDAEGQLGRLGGIPDVLPVALGVDLQLAVLGHRQRQPGHTSLLARRQGRDVVRGGAGQVVGLGHYLASCSKTPRDFCRTVDTTDRPQVEWVTIA
jgi:hypothetical protein